MRSELDAEVVTEARQVLSSHRTVAAAAWTRALATAALRGDHRPSRDLLLHTDVIQPVSHTPTGPAVIVNIGTQPGSPLPDIEILSTDGEDGNE
jgi:hypothetical protein